MAQALQIVEVPGDEPNKARIGLGVVHDAISSAA